jgi:hypothetical protein
MLRYAISLVLASELLCVLATMTHYAMVPTTALYNTHY